MRAVRSLPQGCHVILIVWCTARCFQIAGEVFVWGTGDFGALGLGSSIQEKMRPCPVSLAPEVCTDGKVDQYCTLFAQFVPAEKALVPAYSVLSCSV